MTRRLDADDEAGQQHLAVVLAEGDAMIQPLVGGAERALVWIDGATTHAVTKQPRRAGDAESVSGGQPVTPVERIVVEHAIGDWADGLLYARVDVMPEWEANLGSRGRVRGTVRIDSRPRAVLEVN
ncbi:MAG: hypothetical protein OER88_09300 [Planctomycetota bacterium]|nr:hypothetical protein [Planctomycetota bacterium]